VFLGALQNQGRQGIVILAALPRPKAGRAGWALFIYSAFSENTALLDMLGPEE